jgi:hypothetical protein
VLIHIIMGKDVYTHTADFYMSSFEINFALHKLVQCGHFISMSISYHILKSGRRVKEVVSIESWS